MPFQAGDRIGPYHVLAQLGRGGMGEVYRAQDTRLGREVAVKVLLEADAVDDESLRRFERETRAVAALNHPNIVAIHDTGTHNGVPYAVTELLQGETLGERLRSGPLSPARAAEIACQIAEGLAAAHTMGVTHRDVKPENIFLTHDNRAKILDFGIARVENPAMRTGGLRRAATSSSKFLLGTAGYVAPEQVRGSRADFRSDLFALGAVFFEMLTGRRAFEKDSPVETLGAVLKEDPRKHPEAASIPPALSEMVFRCLEKDPADRYQSARDLLLDLRAYQAGALKEAAGRIRFRSEPPWKHRRTRLVVRAAAAVVLFALGIWAGSCWQRGRAARAGDAHPASGASAASR